MKNRVRARWGRLDLDFFNIHKTYIKNCLWQYTISTWFDTITTITITTLSQHCMICNLYTEQREWLMFIHPQSFPRTKLGNTRLLVCSQRHVKAMCIWNGIGPLCDSHDREMIHMLCSAFVFIQEKWQSDVMALTDICHFEPLNSSLTPWLRYYHTS